MTAPMTGRQYCGPDEVLTFENPNAVTLFVDDDGALKFHKVNLDWAELRARDGATQRLYPLALDEQKRPFFEPHWDLFLAAQRGEHSAVFAASREQMLAPGPLMAQGQSLLSFLLAHPEHPSKPETLTDARLIRWLNQHQMMNATGGGWSPEPGVTLLDEALRNRRFALAEQLWSVGLRFGERTLREGRLAASLITPFERWTQPLARQGATPDGTVVIGWLSTWLGRLDQAGSARNIAMDLTLPAGADGVTGRMHLSAFAAAMRLGLREPAALAGWTPPTRWGGRRKPAANTVDFSERLKDEWLDLVLPFLAPAVVGDEPTIDSSLFPDAPEGVPLFQYAQRLGFADWSRQLEAQALTAHTPTALKPTALKTRL